MIESRILEGTFISNKKGFGFVEFADRTERLFIPPKYKGNAIHGDIVTVEVVDDDYNPSKGEKQVGKIVKVIKHTLREVVGTLRIINEGKNEFGFVIPDDPHINTDVYISEADLDGYEDNIKVLCEIRRYPNCKDKKPEGVITKVIGIKGDRFTELNAVLERFSLRDEFPDNVISEAKVAANQSIKEEMERRTIYRYPEHVVFTIDPKDARDLDDAISIVKNSDDTYTLGVHIADVRHYVKEGSKLYKEAVKRATSCYLVEKVIPMLPKELSNGACSLHPGEPKLCLSVIMKINKKGKVLSHSIEETVIESHAKLAYEDAYGIINEDEELLSKYSDLVESIMSANELAQILVRRRNKLGAIDFEFEEDKITLDDNGEVISVTPYPKTFANKIIEEFMLMANETVAEEFFWLETPFIYRVHETPSQEKMENFSKVISGFGYSIKGGIEDVHPKALQQLLKKVKDTPEETLISTMLLRSLKQAKYMPHCAGHFGLSVNYYCHFTSPIRRLGDMIIHGVIKDHINGRLNESRKKHYQQQMNELSIQASLMERTAEKAEEAVHAYYRAKYIIARAEEEFEASIFNISGQYVTVLINDIIKAKIDVTTLMGDIYVFNPINYTLVGHTSGEIAYKIGDKLKVKLSHIDEYIYDIYVTEVKDGEE